VYFLIFNLEQPYLCTMLHMVIKESHSMGIFLFILTLIFYLNLEHHILCTLTVLINHNALITIITRSLHDMHSLHELITRYALITRTAARNTHYPQTASRCNQFTYTAPTSHRLHYPQSTDCSKMHSLHIHCSKMHTRYCCVFSFTYGIFD